MIFIAISIFSVLKLINKLINKFENKRFRGINPKIKVENIDEVIGLGLSDKSFFRQSIEKIKAIDSDNNTKNTECENLKKFLTKLNDEKFYINKKNIYKINIY